MTIQIAPDVTEADGLQDIRDGLGRAQAYYEKVAGPNPLTSLLVIVHRKDETDDPSGRVCCPASPGKTPPVIELKVNYQEWIKSRDTRLPGTYFRQYVVAHELWHVWQNKMGCPSHDYRRPLWPVWITEGGAEFMQWQVMLGSGIVTPAQLVNLERQMASENVRLGAGTLLSLEAGEYGNLGFYSKGYFGTKRLVERSGVAGLRMFCNEMGAGAEWPTAFARAFGIESAAFYAEFEAWYSTTYPAPAVAPPAPPLVAPAAPGPAVLPGPVGIYADITSPAAYQPVTFLASGVAPGTMVTFVSLSDPSRTHPGAGTFAVRPNGSFYSLTPGTAFGGQPGVYVIRFRMNGALYDVRLTLPAIKS